MNLSRVFLILLILCALVPFLWSKKMVITQYEKATTAKGISFAVVAFSYSHLSGGSRLTNNS